MTRVAASLPRAPLAALVVGALLLAMSLPQGGCDGDLCGNGVLDPGEACDDGNHAPHDACNNLCTVPTTVAWTYAETSPVHGHISAHGIEVAGDGSIYIIGTAAQTNAGDHLAVKDHGALIRKLTPWGEPAWLATSDEGGSLRDLLVAEDGGPLIVGSDAHNVWLRRYTFDGVPVWTTHNRRGGTSGQALVRLPGDTLLVGGAGTAGEAPWLERLRNDGEFLDHVRIATESPNGEVRTLVAADNRIFAAGTTEGEALVAALDEALETLWIDTAIAGVADAIARVDRDVIVAGRARAQDGELAARSWIRRLRGRDGAEVWRHDLDALIADLAVDPDDALVVVGARTGPPMIAWIAKLDDEGTLLWSVDEPLAELQGEGVSEATSVALDGEGRIFVAGYARDSAGYARLWAQERAP